MGYIIASNGRCSQIWATVNAGLADQCLAPDAELDQAIIGRVYKGVAAVKNLITSYYAKVRRPQLISCFHCFLRQDSAVADALYIPAQYLF